MISTVSGPREDSRPAVAAPHSALAALTEAGILAALAEAVAALLQPRREAWTKAEAAVKLGVTESWLEDMAAKRKIPFTKLSGALHFTDGHLAEIIALFEVRPAAKARPAAAAPAPRQSQAKGPVGVPRLPMLPAGVPQLQARAPRGRGAA